MDSDHGVFAFMDSEALVVEAEDTNDHRAHVYWDDDEERYVYRASALGNCVKALTFHHSGITPHEPPGAIQAAYKAGNRLEPIIIRRFCEAAGWAMLDAVKIAQYGVVTDNGQIEVQLNVGSKATVRCHPDGVAQCFKRKDGDPFEIGEHRVVEVKALGRSFYDRYKREGIKGIPFYDWQWAVEMAGTGLKGAYVIGVKCDTCKGAGCDDGMCKDGLTELDITYYEAPTHSKAEIIKRVLYLERLAADHEAGEVIECDWKMYPCGFFAAHDTTKGVWAKEKTTLDDDKAAQLSEWVAEYRSHQAAIDEHAQFTERLKEQIKALLSDAGLASYHDDLVTYTERTNPGQVDQQKLRDAGIDVDQFRKPSSLVRALKIAPLKKKEGVKG